MSTVNNGKYKTLSVTSPTGASVGALVTFDVTVDTP